MTKQGALILGKGMRLVRNLSNRCRSAARNYPLRVALLFALPLFGVMAATFMQVDWSGGVPPDSSTCGSAGGTWTGADCIAVDPTNQSGWTAYSSKDADVTVINSGADLQLGTVSDSISQNSYTDFALNLNTSKTFNTDLAFSRGATLSGVLVRAGQVKLGFTAHTPTWAGAGGTWSTDSFGTYNLGSGLYDANKIALGDLDADGDYDLLVGNNNGITYVYQNTGSTSAPTWTAKSLWYVPAAGAHAAPAVGDLDGDGDLDLLIGTTNNGVLGYENTGSKYSPVWTRKPAWDIPAAAFAAIYANPALADLDGDGDLDLMVSDSSGTIYAYRNEGTPQSPNWVRHPAWDVSTGNSGVAPSLGDVDGDGKIDLYAGGVANGVYQNIGTPTDPSWSQNMTWVTPAGSAALADLDGDGDLDIMLGQPSNYFGQVIGYIDNGAITYGTSGTYTSAVVDTVSNNGFTTLDYNPTGTANTSLQVNIRAGDSTDTSDASWTSWQPNIAPGGDISMLGNRRYVQFEAVLTTTDTTVTPSLGQVVINYANYPNGTNAEYTTNNDTISGPGLKLNISPSAVSSFAFGSYYTSAMQVVGNYAYVAEDNGGSSSSYFRVVDVSDPTAPVSVTTRTLPANPVNVHISGNYAYIPSQSAGLTIVDISTPTSPVVISTTNTPGYAKDVEIVGNYAYVDDSTSVQIMDVSNPAAPSIVGSIALPSGDSWGLTMSSHYLYVTDRNVGLYIYDITNPTVPTLINTYSIAGIYDVFVVGTHIFLTGTSFTVLDASNPAAPTYAGAYSFGSTAIIQTSIAGHYAYMVGGSLIRVIDFADPGVPQMVATIGIPGYAVSASGAYVYNAGINAFRDVSLGTYATSGTYTSSVMDPGPNTGFTTLDYTADIPANTGLTVDVRAGNTTDPDDGSWIAWQPGIANGGDISALDGNRYVQYRVKLTTSAPTLSTAVLHDITFNYTRYAYSSSLISSAYNTTDLNNLFDSLGWTQTLPAGTDVRIQVRTAADNSGSPGTWGDWVGPDSTSNSYWSSANDYTGGCSGTTTVSCSALADYLRDGLNDQWFEYRITLVSSGDQTPTLSDVSLNYGTTGSGNFLVTPTSGLTTTEAGGTANFDVSLTSAPSADVTIHLYSSDTTEGTVSPSSLTFTTGNWSTPQTVTVTGVDDLVDDGDIAYNVVTTASVSADPAFNDVNPPDVSLVNSDDDTAGINVSPASGLVTTEAGGSDNFTVKLNSQPVADVTIGFTSSDTTEGTPSPASLTFDASNWNVPQVVTVTGVDDHIIDGNVAYSIVTAPATSTDPKYSGMDASDVAVTNNDDDVADIAVTSSSGFQTTDAGGSDLLNVTLTSQPSANVTLSLSSSDTTEGLLLSNSLLFTPSNWNVPQSFFVSGVSDGVVDGNQTYAIQTSFINTSDPSFGAANPTDISMTSIDTDGYTITVTPIGVRTDENGKIDQFRIILGSSPTANVTINLSSSDPTEAIPSPSSVTFTPGGSTVAKVAVTGVDDAKIDGNRTYTIITAPAVSTDPNYSGKDPADVSGLNADNDLVQQTLVNPTSYAVQIAGVADINCDNIPDLLWVSGSFYHYVYVRYGSPTGYSSSQVLVMSDATGTNNIGSVITSVGDVNHDGCNDLAISGTGGNGVVNVFYGHPGGISTTSFSNPDWSVTGDAAADQFGYTVTAGDFNGDGNPDLAIGGPHAADGETYEGRVWVFFGTASGLPGTAGVAMTSDAAWSFESDMANGMATGYNGLATANVNGDAYDDLIIGVPGASNGQTGEGRVYAFYGSATGFNDADADTIARPSDADWAAESDITSLGFGGTLANAGRVSGGSYDAIIVGTPGYSNGQSNEGAAFVFLGSATGLRAPTAGDNIVRAQTENDGMVESNVVSGLLGTRVNSAGDINHDGYGDIIVSAPSVNAYNALGGYEVIYPGSATGILSTPLAAFSPNLGRLAVGTLGDLNGDGYPDLYVADYAPYYGSLYALMSNISTPGFTVTPTSGLTTSESGGTAAFSVSVTSPPSADVTVDLSSDNTAEGTVSPAQLVFNQSNWQQAQTVTVTGVNDAVTDGPVAYTIVLDPAVSSDSNYSGLDPADVSLTNLDNDVPATVTVAATDAPENGQGSITFTRPSEITSDLTVDYTVGGTAVAGSDYTALSGSVVIPTGSASVTVPVTPINDSVAQGNRTVIVTVLDGTGYTAGTPASATVNIVDDDTVGVKVSPTAGLVTTEAGGTASFSMVLTSQPGADVTVNLSSSDTSEGQVIPASLTFTPSNWSMSQSVTVVGLDDTLSDGDIAYIVTSTVASGDTQYNGLAVSNVSLINRDDENLSKVQVVATKARVTEGATPGEFTVSRSGSTAADLRVFYTVSGSATRGVDYYSLPGTITIPAGSSSATVNVGTIQDSILENDETVILSLVPATDYIVGQPDAATVVISDDDQPHVPVANFVVDQTVAEGATVTVTAVLSGAASAYPVTIPYTVGGTATNPGDHDAADGNIVINSGTSGSVTFNVVSDAVAEPAETVVFTMGTPVNAAAGTKTTHTVTILESNGAPKASLQTVQNSADTRLVVTGDGSVTVTASVTDPNAGDTFSYDWSLSNAALLDINDGDPATFVFDPSALAPGFYKVRLTVTDSGSPPLSTSVETLLEVAASAPVLNSANDSDNDGIADDVESYKDSDGDGIPDYLDNDTLASNELQLLSSTTGYRMRTEQGLTLGLGNVAFAAGADGALVSEADIAAYGGGEGNAGSASAQDSVPNTGGYFDFEISQLPEAGQSVQVVIPQLAPIPSGASYRKYDPVSGWRDFVTDAANAIASAPGTPGECPMPGDAAFTPGLTAGYHCIQLTIQDGGPNDTDGMANHVIADPGQIGAEAVDTTAMPSGNGDTNSSAMPASNGGGAVDLVLLGMMLTLLLGRFRSGIMRR